ncbi:MAG: MFS transporter [Lachnospiraceae bacterium]|nr:MFS transporter [Lachnospiraceae bacterium]
MKTMEQINSKDLKELSRRKAQRNQKILKYGLLMTLAALFLASVVDEISSAIGVQIQSSVVTEFFANPLNLPYNEAMSMFSTVTMFSYALMSLVPFYKALADKFGRKPFLVFNTVGMGIGMLLAWWSPNVVVYFIGYGLTIFFVQHDMQIVYLYEIVPKEKRATIYGLIKGISTLGVVLIPVLRGAVMGNDTTLWRGVYLLPAVIAIGVSIFSFVVTRESKTFLEQRIAYLESSYEERHPEKKKLSREEKKAQKTTNNPQKSGVFHALGHLFKNKQLFWLSIVSMVFALGSTTISGFSESIMTDFGMTAEAVNQALLVYPFLYAALICGAGFVGDKLGRKTIVGVCGTLAVAGFIGFNLSAFFGASPYLIGIFYGLYLGCWWITLDYCSMMVAESAPTYNRGSVLGAVGLITMVGSGLGQVVPIIAVLLFDKIGFGYMAASMPFAFAGVLLMLLKIKETKGVDLNQVTY